MDRSAGRPRDEERPSNLKGTEAAVTAAAAGVETAETFPNDVHPLPAAAPSPPTEGDAGLYRVVFSCASCPPDTPT